MGGEILLCDTCSHAFSSDLLPSAKENAQMAEVLRSNREHPDPSFLHTVISSSPAELVRFDEEIGRLKAIVDRLQAARAALQSHYDACRSVVSALPRLPSEILCDVFALIPPDARSDYRRIDIDKGIKEESRCVAQVQLLRVAGVCSRWYGLVMGTPALWTEILLEARYWEYSHGPDRARMLRMLSSVLDRGANSPLNLRFGYGRGRLPAPELLKLLAQHSRRWRQVSVWMIDRNIGCLSAVKGQLPLLEALTVHGESLKARGQDLLDLFKDAPRLTSLTFYGAVKALSTFPAKQLQHCALHIEPKQLGAALSFANDLSSSAKLCLEAMLIVSTFCVV
ncbi:hypothetical protein C8J57DRAFT_1177781 [Mycena rebaudengoi]|nr:hypothetical protein C8J57DRAFT_1177781 [Mycena rebaudengoi]